MQLPHLPIFTNSDEALALAERHQDFFYLVAFKIQTWVDDLLPQAMAEYISKPDPAERAMQTGQASRAFQPALGCVRDEDFHQVIQCLQRFAECQTPTCHQLRRTLLPVYGEHELSGDFLGPEGPDLSHGPLPAAPLMRRFVERVCDWLDAVIHINTHILWIHQPACFDPNPETRRQAGLELAQPVAAELNEAALVPAYVRPGAPARRSRSGSPTLPSTAPSPNLPHSALHTPHSNPRPWPFPKMDEAIITFWPLLKLHHWTYPDLWNVLHQGGIPLPSTPCPDHHRLAHYCCHTLGLRNPGHGQTARNSLPPGHELALRLLDASFKRRSPPLGRGPWS